MSTIEQIIAAQQAAEKQTKAEKEAAAKAASAATKKATKERGKQVTAGDVEQSAFIAASTAGSELLQALAEYRRGAIDKNTADAKLTAFQNSLSALRAINSDRAAAVEKSVLPKNVSLSENIPKIDTSIGPKPIAKTPTPTKPSTPKKPVSKPVTPAEITSTGATFEDVGAKPFTQPMTLAGAGQFSTAGVAGSSRLDTAIAKAIELYQMPDIIFNNVPELKAILEKYLDPNKPITLDQFVKEVGNSTWYRQNSKTIQNRYLQKFNYDDLKKSGLAVGDTQYEKDIKTITENVINKARELGSPMDPTQAQLIAEDLYIHNMETDMTALTKRLAGSIRVTPLGTTGLKGYSGLAQANYQTLLGLAKNNGLNLRNILPTRIVGSVDKPLTDEELTNNVLAGLADGSIDISTIEQTARVLASQGQPQYIKDLLAQGYDLAAIYAPYKKTMATVLELNPDQIDLNDPTLRMAITPNGDMNTYDYTKLLRKDNRWQYTNQAKEEVASATQKILQDFGFMG